MLNLQSFILPMITRKRYSVASTSIQQNFVNNGAAFSVVYPVAPSTEVVTKLQCLGTDSGTDPAGSTVSYARTKTDTVDL